MADLSQPAGAILSPDRTYRYRSWRSVTDPDQHTLEDFEQPGRRTVAFILLNPSTADETSDDQTLRRCLGYAERWGYDRVELGNLFAYRATDPADLKSYPEPVGPRNDEHLRAIATDADRIVAAWGNLGDYRGRDREVGELLDVEWSAVHVNATGQPAHPARLPADLDPEPFEPR